MVTAVMAVPPEVAANLVVAELEVRLTVSAVVVGLLNGVLFLDGDRSEGGGGWPRCR